jgi:HK97 family phage portal protein
VGLLSFLASRRTSPDKIPQAHASLMWQGQPSEKGRVGKQGANVYRSWAERSEWVRAAINVRKTQISSAEWDIVPFDTSQKYPRRTQRDVRDLFNQPNEMADSFRSFVEPLVEDILTLDAGVVEKVRDLGDRLAELYYVDGAKIRIDAFWDGGDEPRYFWYPDGFMRAAFSNADMLYIMSNPATYRVVGLAPLETLRNTIDSELSGSLYNQRQVENAAPDGMLDLGEGFRPEQVEAFKSYWAAEVAGKGATAFLGGSRNAKFIPFRSTNRDMQFLEWQTYLVRKIAAVFGLSPQDLGLTFDINRATSEVVAEQTEDRGLRPLLALIQDYFTREIVWDKSFGGRGNNLAFRFTRLNLKETTSKANINKLALGRR